MFHKQQLKYILQDSVNLDNHRKKINIDLFNYERYREKRIDQILKCSEQGHIKYMLISKKGEYTVKKVKITCNSRVCRKCMLKLQNIKKSLISSIIVKYRKPTLATFSPKNYETLSNEDIKKEIRVFARTREYIRRGDNIKTGKKYVFDNSVYVMEIKFHRKGERKYRYEKVHGQINKVYYGVYKEDSWNIHFHMIYDGDYIPKKFAINCFKKASGNRSYNVDLRYLYNVKDIVSYISKYISKINFQNEDIHLVKKYYKETRKIKFISIYGYRPEKISEYEQIYNNLRYSHLNYYDLVTLEYELLGCMILYDINTYELELSAEENFFKYSKTNRILGCLGFLE